MSAPAMKQSGFPDMTTAALMSALLCTSLKISCISTITSPFKEFTLDN